MRNNKCKNQEANLLNKIFSHNKGNFRKTKTISVMTILCIVILLIVIWKNGNLGEDKATASQGESDRVGQTEVVRAELITHMADPEGSFVYFYKPDCDGCNRMDQTILPMADEKGLTVHKINADKLENMEAVAQVENVPSIVYYNKGWKMAWIEGDAKESAFKDFFDHFNLKEG